MIVPFVWALRSSFVDDVLEVFPSREQAEETLRRVVEDEPVWNGRLSVVQLVYTDFCPN